MNPIELIKGSDGNGNAATATVQSARLSGASTINVDVVDNINPTGFIGTMGTPHTFVDPVTSEEITIISEETAVDFVGHIDGENIEIDEIAPGYSDGGNEVGDIIVIRPTTHWANKVSEAVSTAIETAETAETTVASYGDWRDIPGPVISVTALGNGSFSVVTTGDDTDLVSEGMRVRTTRTVPASNTSFSLDGSNDYYVKTSPNKMTFTDDFAVGFWIYPTAYPGTFAGIASRYNGTSGWEFLLDSKGCLILIGHNAGSGNFRGVTSYQSVPLNKWTFVAAQLDMSAHTATTTTSYVMMNGLDVPAYVSQAGTNPTALVAAGNFEIGSVSGGTNPFTGYIGDGGVFSAKVTQSTMLGYMNQPLTGTETNLASGYANGSVNDLNTTTPNNLTATNGATTVANSPYGNRGASTTFDYGVVMKKSFSTNTTFTIQVPEGCTIPTTGGVSSIEYSVNDTPYGFPRDKGRWYLSTDIIATTPNTTISAASSAVYPSSAIRLKAPVGSWELGWQGFIESTSGVAVTNLEAHGTIYDVTNSVGVGTTLRNNNGASANYTDLVGQTEVPISLSAPTDYSFAGGCSNFSGSSSWTTGGTTPIGSRGNAMQLYLKNAYI